MQDLLEEYKKTLQLTTSEMRNIYEAKDPERYYKMLCGAKRDLEYAIEWMERHGQPDNKTDINRYSSEKRTVSMEEATLEKIYYDHDMTPSESGETAEESMLFETLRNLLGPKHFTLLELKVRGFSAHEIAQLVDMKAGHVRRDMKKIFEKIRHWIYQNDTEFEEEQDPHEAIERFLKEQEKRQMMKYMTDELTKKQLEILKLYMSGLSQSAIKDLLKISDAYVCKVIGKCRKRAERKGWSI